MADLQFLCFILCENLLSWTERRLIVLWLGWVTTRTECALRAGQDGVCEEVLGQGALEHLSSVQTLGAVGLDCGVWLFLLHEPLLGVSDSKWKIWLVFVVGASSSTPEVRHYYMCVLSWLQSLDIFWSQSMETWQTLTAQTPYLAVCAAHCIS